MIAILTIIQVNIGNMDKIYNSQHIKESHTGTELLGNVTTIYMLYN